MMAPILSQMSASRQRAGGLAGRDSPFLRINSSITPVYLTKSINSASSLVSEALDSALSKRSAVRTGLDVVICDASNGLEAVYGHPDMDLGIDDFHFKGLLSGSVLEALITEPSPRLSLMGDPAARSKGLCVIDGTASNCLPQY